MIRGLRTVIYQVTDLAQAKAWYTRVLEQEPYFDQPFYVGYSVGGFELGLAALGHHQLSAHSGASGNEGPNLERNLRTGAVPPCS